MKETVKILGAHFCYNKKLEHKFSKPYRKNWKRSKAMAYDELND